MTSRGSCSTGFSLPQRPEGFLPPLNDIVASVDGKSSLQVRLLVFVEEHGDAGSAWRGETTNCRWSATALTGPAKRHEASKAPMNQKLDEILKD